MVNKQSDNACTRTMCVQQTRTLLGNVVRKKKTQLPRWKKGDVCVRYAVAVGPRVFDGPDFLTFFLHGPLGVSVQLSRREFSSFWRSMCTNSETKYFSFSSFNTDLYGHALKCLDVRIWWHFRSHRFYVCECWWSLMIGFQKEVIICSNSVTKHQKLSTTVQVDFNSQFVGPNKTVLIFLTKQMKPDFTLPQRLNGSDG